MNEQYRTVYVTKNESRKLLTSVMGMIFKGQLCIMFTN